MERRLGSLINANFSSGYLRNRSYCDASLVWCGFRKIFMVLMKPLMVRCGFDRKPHRVYHWKPWPEILSNALPGLELLPLAQVTFCLSSASLVLSRDQLLVLFLYWKLCDCKEVVTWSNESLCTKTLSPKKKGPPVRLQKEICGRWSPRQNQALNVSWSAAVTGFIFRSWFWKWREREERTREF